MQKRRMIFGPPGTGKTTFLINLIEKELTTTDPAQIAYVSYTKKGTYEGVERAREAFDLKEQDIPFFRTLHSLCFRAVGAQRDEMLTAKHYKYFSRMLGIPFTGYYTEDRRSANDLYLHAISMRVHNRRLFTELSEQLDPQKLNYILTQYEAMKQQLDLRDFDDLLVEYLKDGEPLDVKVAFVDEAQDLTPLQWHVVMQMFKHAERIYVAGDDDQAVYTWAGADVAQFLRFSKDQHVLSHSYRLPKKIFDMANNVAQDIRVRKEKVFTPNDNEGLVTHAAVVSDIDIQGGELILARTNHLLAKTTEWLRNKGIRYILKGKPSVAPSVLHAIDAYNKHQKGEESSITTYKEYFNAFNDEPWYKNLAYLPETVAYIERAIQNTTPPVRLETFHSCKGSEAEHVILITDLTAKVSEALNTDDEMRCLYVALTRSKNELTVVAPATQEHYPLHYFTEAGVRGGLKIGRKKVLQEKTEGVP